MPSFGVRALRRALSGISRLWRHAARYRKNASKIIRYGTCCLVSQPSGCGDVRRLCGWRYLRGDLRARNFCFVQVGVRGCCRRACVCTDMDHMLCVGSGSAARYHRAYLDAGKGKAVALTARSCARKRPRFCGLVVAVAQSPATSRDRGLADAPVSVAEYQRFASSVQYPSFVARLWAWLNWRVSARPRRRAVYRSSGDTPPGP